MTTIAGHLTTNQLQPAHIAAIHATWKQRLSRNSLTLYTVALRQIVQRAASESNRPQLMQSMPHAPSYRPRTIIATPQDIDRLTAAAPAWLRAAIQIGQHAAMRVSDAVKLAEADYDAEQHTITFTQQKTDTKVTLPADDTITAVIENAPPYGDRFTPIVSRYAGKPVTANNTTHAFGKLRKRCAIDQRLTFHDLRRTTAVALYEVSKDLRIVEQMLGHQSLTSTIRYLEHRDPAKLAPLLAALHHPMKGVPN